MTSASNILATPSIVVNDIVINYVPNSLKYTEGRGEQSVRTQAAGGNSVSFVYSQNAGTKFSSVKFDMYSSDANIALALGWKDNGFNNTISFVSDDFSRNMSNCAVVNDYEITLGLDGTFSLEWKGTQVQ